jgi:hypothetical protein
MNLKVKKIIETTQPVKAFKVVCHAGNMWFTGPFRLEKVHMDNWAVATQRAGVAFLPFDPGYQVA